MVRDMKTSKMIPSDNDSRDLGIIQMGIEWCLVAQPDHAEQRRILISPEACYPMNMVLIFSRYWD